jgi:hypothetical protein
VHQRAFVLIFVKSHVLELVEFDKIQPHTPTVGTVVHFDHPLVIFPGQRSGAFGAIHTEKLPEQTDESEAIILPAREQEKYSKFTPHDN